VLTEFGAQDILELIPVEISVPELELASIWCCREGLKHRIWIPGKCMA